MTAQGKEFPSTGIEFKLQLDPLTNFAFVFWHILIMICLSVYPLEFILLGIHWASCIYKLVHLQIFFLPLIISSLLRLSICFDLNACFLQVSRIFSLSSFLLFSKYWIIWTNHHSLVYFITTLFQFCYFLYLSLYQYSLFSEIASYTIYFAIYMVSFVFW